MAFDDNFVEPGERDQRYEREKIKNNEYKFSHKFKEQEITVVIVEDEQFNDFSEFEDDEFNVVLISPKFDHNLKKKPMKGGEILEKSDELAQNSLDAQRVTKDDGTLLVHHDPALLSRVAMNLNDEGRRFRYWITLERPIEEDYPIKHTHEGILMYFMHHRNFHYNRIREPHEMCEVCGNYLSDWGGKKDQMNNDGNVISDIWSEISFEEHKGNTKLPVNAIDRLLDLTTEDGFKVLLAPYEGEIQ